MHKMTRHWNASAWIACLAILFNAFAPIVSHAGELRGGARAAVEMEVCTALGMQMMPVPMGAEQSRDPVRSQLHKSINHCGYCVAHAASHSLPPPLTAFFAAAAGRDVFPPLYYHSPRPLFPWSLAQPRAPPALA
jgi:hypothetical protein